MRSTGNQDPAYLLDQEIQAQTGGAETLRTRFAHYARNIWDPTRWTTGALTKILDDFGTQPTAVAVNRSTLDTGTQTVTVDHLASRYVRIYNDGGFQPSGPSDELRIV